VFAFGFDFANRPSPLFLGVAVADSWKPETGSFFPCTREFISDFSLNVG
jgi:hypothetical protein